MLFGLAVVGGVLSGIRLSEDCRGHRALKAAGNLAPRTSFNVAAHRHGLFVPVSTRIVEGARSDWSVNAVEIDINAYGQGFCSAIALPHRDKQDQKIPLIAATLQDGDDGDAPMQASTQRLAIVFSNAALTG